MASIGVWVNIVLLLVFLQQVYSVFIDDHLWTKSCFSGCICDPVEKSVQCYGLQKINIFNLLRTIPEDVLELRIENTQLNQSIEVNLQHWPQLVTFSLSNNKISQLMLTTDFQEHNVKHLMLDRNNLIDINFLEHCQLNRLQVLNVSENNLKVLSPKSLQHLSDLSKLYLGGNQIERIPVGFLNKTIRLKGLYLENNKMDYIHPSLFESLNLLQHLHMHSNSLTTLHNKTFSEMVSLTDLRLDNNPFDCNCALKWLVLDMQSATGKTKYSWNELTKCESPSIYTMVPLYKLQPRDLMCIKPRILAVSGDTTIYYLHDTILRCNVTGYPRPSIYWLTPRGQILSHKLEHRWIDHEIHNKLQGVTTFKAHPTHYESKATALKDGTLHVERIRHYFTGQYLCIAENPAGSVSVNMTLKLVTVMPYTFLMTLWVGGSAAGGFLLFGIVFGLLRWCVESLVDMSRKKTLSMHSKSTESIHSSSCHTPTLYTPGPSPGPSPMLCTTPVSIEDDESHVTVPTIKETLEDVRIRLRSGMEKQVGRIRSRAQHVKEASTQYVQTIKDSSSQYMQSIKESGSQYASSIRSSTGQYAQRVRVGMQVGVEHVKYHVQSMKELCGTGDINQTVSTVSMSTDVDTQERMEVIKSITLV